MKQPRLYVFGTGNAAVTRCYNTCFAIQTSEEYFMIDAGGGNGILRILEEMQVPLSKIHHLFVSHAHSDHILGVVWLIRMIATAMKKNTYEGDLFLYCHDTLPETIRTLCRLTIQDKFYRLIGERIHLIPVTDGEQREILDLKLTFFDLQSTKERQFGFSALLPNGHTLCFAGDEPLPASCHSYAEGCDWLLHEAFCLYRDRERFQPYEKHHSTVKDACELAERLNVRHLLLWHTEDQTAPERKTAYTEEGARFYHGALFVPDDGEILDL